MCFGKFFVNMKKMSYLIIGTDGFVKSVASTKLLDNDGGKKIERGCENVTYLVSG